MYDDATTTQPNYSSQGPAYDMEIANNHGLSTYDCIENTINTPQTEPIHPTPVTDEGKRDDFYNAEQHTYAAVNVKHKKKAEKKTSGNDEGGDNGQNAKVHDTPANPTPDASKKGDDFYEAEEHTYSVVNKKKAKKTSEDGEGEREAGGEEGEY